MSKFLLITSKYFKDDNFFNYFTAAISMQQSLYTWSEKEPIDIDRNIESACKIDIDYYHQFITKSNAEDDEKLVSTEFIDS